MLNLVMQSDQADIESDLPLKFFDLKFLLKHFLTLYQDNEYSNNYPGFKYAPLVKQEHLLLELLLFLLFFIL
jgi:hypothetical protein